jgi:ribosomal protein S18 acetylase RimI-like enzyme
VAQIFVESHVQRRGIGTFVLERVIEEAALAKQPVLLGVVKNNPAVNLYKRLGFRIAHEDERKFYMRREWSTAAQRD